MQTILGAGGAMSRDLAKELKTYTKSIRLVSRNPVKVNPGDELVKADLSIRDNVFRSVAGSEIVYLTVAFDYKVNVWRKKWPELMRNVIDACKKYNAKLVFFDNVYMYDPDYMNRMTEDTPIRPVSKKGAIRAEIAGMLMDAINKKEITALIARSADFISDRNSVLVEMGFKNLQKGKPAMWFVNADKIHNYTVSTDAAKATALLGNSPGVYNQVWHLPTESTPLTGRQWVKIMADELHSEPKINVLQTWMISLMGLFVPVLREFKEMLYQYDRDYFFDSSKFEKHFSFKPTSPKNAIKMVNSRLKPNKSNGGNSISQNNTKDTVVNMK